MLFLQLIEDQQDLEEEAAENQKEHALLLQIQQLQQQQLSAEEALRMKHETGTGD